MILQNHEHNDRCYAFSIEGRRGSGENYIFGLDTLNQSSGTGPFSTLSVNKDTLQLHKDLNKVRRDLIQQYPFTVSSNSYIFYVFVYESTSLVQHPTKTRFTLHEKDCTLVKSFTLNHLNLEENFNAIIQQNLR